MAVKKLKNGKWIADFYISNKRYKRQFPTKKLAELHIIERKSISHTARSSQQHDNFQKLTFKDIASKYLDEHLKKSKAAGNKSYINKLIKIWGEFNIAAISPAETRTWVKSLLESSYEVATVEKYFIYFKRVFNYAIEMELISINPISHISFKKEFKKKNKRNVTLNETDWPEYISLFAKSPWYVGVIVKTLWFTGMRIGEVLNLQWAEAKLKDGVIVLSADKVKEGKVRTIGIEKELLGILMELEEKNNKRGAKGKLHVFGITKDNPLSYVSFYRNYRAAVDGSNYTRFNIHDLRHSYTKRKRQEGHDKEVIKSQMGHTTDSMFNHYNDIDEDEVKEMSGFNEDKLKIIRPQVKKLVQIVKKEHVPLNTLYTAIKDEL